MTSRISVIIPVRNRPEAISNALKSVESQTVQPVEIIVVDDASTDDTVAVVRSHFGGRIPIRLIALPENKGGGFARNAGIDAASGSLVALLDSDDIWLPNRLARQVEKIAGRESERIICFSNLLVDHGDNEPKRPWNTLVFDSRTTPNKYIIDLDQVIQTSTFLMPSDVAREIRFDDGLRRHQDIDFVLRAASAGVRFEYCEEPLVIYSADPAVERTSKRRNVTPSLKWMETAQSYLSEQEIASFYHKHLFEMEVAESTARALCRALRNVAAGRASLKDISQKTARVLLPAAAKNTLRRAFGRSRSR